MSLVLSMAVVDAGAREGGGGRRFAAARNAQRPIERAQLQRQPRPPEPVAVPLPVQPEPAARPARPGRLTPDERRALRQQINDAGREIYRPGRP